MIKKRKRTKLELKMLQGKSISKINLLHIGSKLNLLGLAWEKLDEELSDMLYDEVITVLVNQKKQQQKED
jgi:hypothetical protein